MMTADEIKKVIRKDYLAAYIHSKIDCGMTLAGNGVNASEACSVYKDLANKVGVSIDPPTPDELEELSENSYYQWLAEEMGYESIKDII